MKNKWKYLFIQSKQVFTIYKATAPSGKCYIGYTSRKLRYRIQEHLKDAENGSSTVFHKAIRKYGKDVKFEVLNIYFNRDLAVKMEMYFVKKYNSLINANGYNIKNNIQNTIVNFYTKNYRDKKSRDTKLMWKNNREFLLKKLKIGNKNNRFSKNSIKKSADIRRRVIIDSNGTVYKSMEEVGIQHNTSEANIRSYIKNGYNLNEKRFAYYNDGNYEFKVKFGNKVKCLNNNKIYTSGGEASLDLGLKSPTSINRVCRGERSHYKGFNFIYIKGTV